MNYEYKYLKYKSLYLDLKYKTQSMAIMSGGRPVSNIHLVKIDPKSKKDININNPDDDDFAGNFLKFKKKDNEYIFHIGKFLARGRFAKVYDAINDVPNKNENKNENKKKYVIK